MRINKLSAGFFVCVFLVLLNGCNAELKDLKIQNDTQRKQIAELRSEAQATEVELEQLKRQLAAAEDKSAIEQEALQQKITALEQDLAKKNELIASMQNQLLYGGATLPVELSTMLEDFAEKEAMVTYDESRGIVKFKSDLLFEKGSDKVTPDAVNAVKSLCGILNSEQGKRFDIIIAGHTDDIPILKPETRQKHPTNWHLSAHRAISVLEVMEASKVDSKRMSVRGFSEFRPIVPNKPDKKGEPQNRRVEIYIVPKGM